MSKFTDGIKQGVARTIGMGLAAGAVGLVFGGPGGAVAGFKLGAGLGALGGEG